MIRAHHQEIVTKRVAEDNHAATIMDMFAAEVTAITATPSPTCRLGAEAKEGQPPP